MSTINPGDTVYSQHGQQATFVAASGGEYLVRPIYEDEDGEQEGDVETWRTVFRTPPAPKLDAETAAAEQRLSDLNKQVSTIRDELNELHKGQKARMDRIKQHEGLEMLDRYLAGEITHYVSYHDYYPTARIIPIGETVEDYASASGYGLLTLFPSRTWDNKFTFSVYYKAPSPTYSRTEKVYPCCGEEAAKQKLVEITNALIAEYQELPPARRSYFDHLVGQCHLVGVEMPQSMLDEQKAYHDKEKVKRAEKLRAELSELEASISTEGGAA